MSTAAAEAGVQAPVHFGGLAADIDGRADGRRPPLVFLHGLTFDRTMWRPALAELRAIDLDRQIVSFDLPGHGQSLKLPSYSMLDVGDASGAAVREAGLDAPVVVGHSIGAGIATAYAARYPTSGVVNVDASPPIEPSVRMLHAMRHELRSPLFGAIWTNLAAGLSAEALPESARELVWTTSNPDQEMMLGYWAEMLDHPDLVLDAVGVAMAALRRKKLPYLIVTGSEPAAESERWIRNNLPRACFEVLAPSGHFPHLGFPARFAERLRDTATWPVGASR
jgi:pimeloyl-ACP methyl ester carboxylesterase